MTITVVYVLDKVLWAIKLQKSVVLISQSMLVQSMCGLVPYANRFEVSVYRKMQ